jgi:hypothetical protein
MKRIMVVLLFGFLVTPLGMGAQQSTAQPIWPKTKSEYVATSFEQIPAFPRLLSGYRSENDMDFWNKPFPSKGSIRIVSGNGWQGLDDFPNTMNHCDAGVFMIRWRLVNSNVRIQSSLRYSIDDKSATTKTGTFGYMSGSNCQQPMFRFGETANGSASDFVDLDYELRFWQKAGSISGASRTNASDLTQSAHQGNAKSQIALGMMYYEGIGGVAKNSAQAFYWLRKAAEQGDTEAKRLITDLEHQQEMEKRRARQAAEAKAQEDEAIGIAHLHLKIIHAQWVTLGMTDANGYRREHSRPIQRLTAIGLESKGKSRFDILCYGTTWSDGPDQTTARNSCPALEVGKTYLMDVGGRSVERDIPNTNKRASWQILELCNPEPDGCQQVSTLADR